MRRFIVIRDEGEKEGVLVLKPITFRGVEGGVFNLFARLRAWA